MMNIGNISGPCAEELAKNNDQNSCLNNVKNPNSDLHPSNISKLKVEL